MQLQCKDLAIGYDSKIILKDLNFSIEKGDYLCIVGENGSGKTTLMKTLLHLLSPISGSISLGDGVSVRDIGYLPQQTSIQRDFPASVREIVLSGCQGVGGFRAFYNKADKELARHNMEKMNILEFEKSCYRELSGGQQQRVLLARALCATTKIILLDEPVTGLDPIATADMYELIERLNREDEVSIIMISHDIEASVKYAKHILHLGNRVFFGTTEEYIESGIGSQFSKS